MIDPSSSEEESDEDHGKGGKHGHHGHHGHHGGGHHGSHHHGSGLGAAAGQQSASNLHHHNEHHPGGHGSPGGANLSNHPSHHHHQPQLHGNEKHHLGGPGVGHGGRDHHGGHLHHANSDTSGSLEVPGGGGSTNRALPPSTGASQETINNSLTSSRTNSLPRPTSPSPSLASEKNEVDLQVNENFKSFFFHFNSISNAFSCVTNILSNK